MFYIPDAGIRFKAPFEAVDQEHSDLASLLALLEFIDTNQKYLAKQTYQLYGDNLELVNCINGRGSTREEFQPLLAKAARYRQKYRFSLEWIPSTENSAIDELLD